MRIGLIVPGFSANEHDWCIPALRNLVARLARNDEVRVLTLRYPYRPGHYGLLGARVTALGGGGGQGAASVTLWSRALTTLALEHRVRPFDVLHSFWAGEAGLLAVLAGRYLRIPTVVSLAGGELACLGEISYGGGLAPTDRMKTALALRLAGRVTAGSRHLLAAARNHVPNPGERLRWTPLGVDTAAFRPGLEAVDYGSPRAVQAASLVPVKDQAMLIRACAILRDMGIALRLEIAGAGPLEASLRHLIARLELDGRVAIKGDLPHDHLPGFYHGAVAYVQSSLHEAQGMSLLEAAACGVPAIGAGVGTLAELAPDAAIATSPGEPLELATALATILKSPDLRATMARHARERAEADYSLEKSVERFRSVYAELGGRVK